MKRLVVNLIFLCPFLIFATIDAQKLDYGAFIGSNLNFIFIKSDYEIQDGVKFKPSLSYNVGGYVRTNCKVINLLASIEYCRVRNKFNQNFRDNTGVLLSESESSIINHYIVIDLMGTLKLAKGLYIGTGVSGNNLLKSSLKIDDDLYISGEKVGYVFNNYNYKRITFSIPVIIGYDFERINIFTRLNIGMMNRLTGDSYVKEIDNPLIFGIGYRINKRD